MASVQVKPRIPKGTRDFLPPVLVRRRYVIGLVQNVFEHYGYQPLETPVIEHLDILNGKYGEEGERLIFKILKRGAKAQQGEADLGLRYDLTVPLARVVALHQQELILPFKRYQIQPVWRADRPQKFRYREFYQCDVDAVGSASMLVEAEMIAIIHDIFQRLGFSQYTIRISHRGILNGIGALCALSPEQSAQMCIAIDKLDKIGRDGVRSELERRGIASDRIATILELIAIQGPSAESLPQARTKLAASPVAQQGLTQLAEIFDYLPALGVPPEHYCLDLSLARGLSYYTGPIFEAQVETPRAGSLCGGGRYDGLIGLFLGRDIPACGTTIGLERIIDVMQALDLFPAHLRTGAPLLVSVFNDQLRQAALTVAHQLRGAGIACEVYCGKDDLRRQIKYALKREMRWVVVIGPDEWQAQQVTFQDLEQRSREKVALTDLVTYCQKRYGLGTRSTDEHGK